MSKMISAIFVLFYVNLFGQEIENNRLIVFGDVETSIPADNASFTFEVEGEGSTLAEAVDKARKEVKIISKVLFSIGLSDKNLRTSYFHSGENFGDKAFLSSSRDFVAGITVVVDIDSLDLLEPAIIKVSETKPKRISDINYTLKIFEQYKLENLQKALLKTQEKARLMATTVGVKLGDILFIEEIQPEPVEIRGGSLPNLAFKARADLFEAQSYEAFGASFFAQDIKLSSHVKVIFGLNADNSQ